MNLDLLAMRKKQELKSLTSVKVSLPQENTHDYFCNWGGGYWENRRGEIAEMHSSKTHTQPETEE